MSEPFIGEVRLLSFNWAPRGWALCNGQLLPISQNDALFSLIGCNYGGDCRTTFALPDMRGRVAVHEGQGSGLSNYVLAERVGTETVTLTNLQIPSHDHIGSGTIQATSAVGNQLDPKGRYLAQEGTVGVPVYHDGPGDETMAAGNVNVIVNSNGGGQSHTNLQPLLVMNYSIALVGLYPSRN